MAEFSDWAALHGRGAACLDGLVLVTFGYKSADSRIRMIGSGYRSECFRPTV